MDVNPRSESGFMKSALAEMGGRLNALARCANRRLLRRRIRSEFKRRFRLQPDELQVS